MKARSPQVRGSTKLGRASRKQAVVINLRHAKPSVPFRPRNWATVVAFEWGTSSSQAVDYRAVLCVYVHKVRHASVCSVSHETERDRSCVQFVIVRLSVKEACDVKWSRLRFERGVALKLIGNKNKKLTVFAQDVVTTGATIPSDFPEWLASVLGEFPSKLRNVQQVAGLPRVKVTLRRISFQ